MTEDPILLHKEAATDKPTGEKTAGAQAGRLPEVLPAKPGNRTSEKPRTVPSPLLSACHPLRSILLQLQESSLLNQPGPRATMWNCT